MLRSPIITCGKFRTYHNVLGDSLKTITSRRIRSTIFIRKLHYYDKGTSKPTLLQRLVAKAPPSLTPYLSLIRIDRPIGTYLLFWPCAWSLTLAAPNGSFPDPYLFLLFATGAFLMRGAGCIVNDYWDRNLDKHVERTKSRPLASNQIRTRTAILYLGIHLSLSLAILLQFPWYAIGLGFLVMPIVMLYPGVKRVSHWPQLVLGMAFNWGALLGYAAVRGTLDFGITLPLYIAGICWTLVYDTIYAHQDKKDDEIVGIKSTAIRFGENTKLWLTAFSCITIGGLTLAGYSAGLAIPFYISMICAASHLAWQIITVNIHDEVDCGKKFRSNKLFGALVWLGMLIGKLMA